MLFGGGNIVEKDLVLKVMGVLFAVLIGLITFKRMRRYQRWNRAVGSRHASMSNIIWGFVVISLIVLIVVSWRH